MVLVGWRGADAPRGPTPKDPKDPGRGGVAAGNENGHNPPTIVGGIG